MGQSVPSKGPEVPKQLQALDARLVRQLQELGDACAAALSEDGQQNPEWWEVNERLHPLTVYGPSVLKYARDHVGTPESLVCLAYIVDTGEGMPPALYRSAWDELIAHHHHDPAMSWLCSRCTEPLYLHEMRSFLIRLCDASSNADVKAAATFQQAELLDAALQLHGRVREVRDIFETAGLLEAHPAIADRLRSIAQLDADELAAERDELLQEVVANFPQCRSWSAKRTFGRLNYAFQENPSGRTFAERASQLVYEIKNLRVGCIAPDFKGTDIQGQTFHLASRRGQTTLLMFSFKGCGSCEAMYPALRKIQERFSQSGFSVIGVMVDEEIDTVTEAVSNGDITWPCVWDGPSGPIAEAYKIRGYPTVVLLDRDGKIRATALRTEEHLIEHLQKVIQDE